jgi:Probable zinc-ribbon domain
MLDIQTNTENTDTPNFKTSILKCVECHFDYLLTDKEQLAYFRKGLAMPRRCPECRQRRRREKEEAALTASIVEQEGGAK